MTGSRPRLVNLSRLLAVLIGLSFVGEMAAVVWLRYSASPPETDCRDIPSGTVVLAPAFWNLGRNASTGRYWPGRANQRIARKLEACADRFSLVLTQQAVSDALAVPDKLSNGTPVWSMHADVPRYVSTLEALQYVKAQSHSARAVHVEIGGESSPQVEREWRKWESDIPLVVLQSPYRDLTGVLLRYIEQVKAEESFDYVTVVLPEFAVQTWWESLLHNHTVLWLQIGLRQCTGVATLHMRYRL